MEYAGAHQQQQQQHQQQQHHQQQQQPQQQQPPPPPPPPPQQQQQRPQQQQQQRRQQQQQEEETGPPEVAFPKMGPSGWWRKYHTWQNYVGGGILLLSYAFCIPGLFLYDSCIAKSLLDQNVRHYSAWGLVTLLWNAGSNELKNEVDPTLTKIPAALIMFFCIVMPFLKLFATILGVFLQSESILWAVATWICLG
ncbi:unnamed protein product [Polarella glacialis]|uniref:Uncharacterized protein n=1 Tax=Polarella glacialis TaxID=89957 RepID=A0A813I163_POLGL|nr:unnamed protein product [Polarella glacialis]